jgi:hypothetical protein
MAKSPSKKKAKAVMLGIGLDSDGHKRVLPSSAARKTHTRR